MTDVLKRYQSSQNSVILDKILGSGLSQEFFSTFLITII